jgi:nucleoside-diphosphate-sugar epimerase
MKILIVGGSGFVGRNLLAYVAQEMPSSQIYATYCHEHTFPAIAAQYNATPIQIDLTKSTPAPSIPICDVCYMVAGSAYHGLSPEEAQSEVGAFLNFLRHYTGKVVLLSSGAVYFNQAGCMSEDMAIFPRFPYGTAKFTKEQYLQYFYDIGKIEQFAILRLFYGFGIEERKTRLCRRVIETLDAGRSSFTVSSQGNSFIDPLSITDVVRAVKDVGLSSSCHEQTINLCRGEPYRVHEFVSFIAQSLGKEITVNFDREPETYPVNFWGNASKLKALTDFKASPLSDDIRHYADWIQQYTKAS